MGVHWMSHTQPTHWEDQHHENFGRLVVCLDNGLFLWRRIFSVILCVGVNFALLGQQLQAHFRDIIPSKDILHKIAGCIYIHLHPIAHALMQAASSSLAPHCMSGNGASHEGTASRERDARLTRVL